LPAVPPSAVKSLDESLCREEHMNQKNGDPEFDPMEFLSKVNGGRTVAEYAPHQTVYCQGAPADAVFYVQKGKAKVPPPP
jgi:CRP-like cAMP-binding protein